MQSKTMKKFKKLLSFALALALVVSVVPADVAKAADTAPIGIDVSWEEGTIDWAQASGEVDFAVIRATEGTVADDEFANNADGCTANGVPFGVSVYTLAQSAEDAVAEAEAALALLEGYTVELPIYMEFEDADMYALSDAEILAVVTAFVDTVTAAGYEAGLYATIDTYNFYFAENAYYAGLNIWVSDLDSTSLPLASANMWQYSWEGTVAGVDADASLNYFYGDLPVEEHTHTPVVDAAVAPTCTATGLTEGSHCLECGEVLVAQEVVPALGHTPETDAAVAPDCDSTGLTEGSHCSVCGEVLTAQEVVAALGHTPGEAVTENVVAKTSIDRVVYCSVCGTEISRNTIPLLRVSGATLALENDISIIYKTKASSVDGYYTGVYAVVKQQLEGSEVRETIIEGVLSADGSNYEFLYSGVAAKEVGDLMDITVYGYYNGDLIEGETKEDYGVMVYVTSQLAKTASKLGMTTARAAVFKTLLVDLVYYASEAQAYFDYKTEAPATSQLSDEYLALASDDSVLDGMEKITNTTYETVDNPTVTWKAATLQLLSKATVRVKITYSGNIEDLTLYARIDEDEVVEVTSCELISGTTNQYYFYFDELVARQFSAPIDFYFMQGDTVVSNTLRYSVESYAVGALSNATVGPVVKAMMKYGYAAATFGETQ